MAISNKFLHFDNKTSFLNVISTYVDYYERNNVYIIKSGKKDVWRTFKNYICFIKDSHEIWTREHFYKCDVNKEDVEKIITKKGYITSDDLASLNSGTANKLQTSRAISLSGAVSGNGLFDGSEDLNLVTTLNNLDASKITSGTISADRLPKGSLERLVIVADSTARFKLTTNEVQEGDTVKQNDTGVMYFVVDTNNLNNENGYKIYTAISSWNTITNKPKTWDELGVTGTINNNLVTGTYLKGNKGNTLINSTANAGSFVMLDKLNSTNGYFTDGVYLKKRILNYTSKSTVDSEELSVDFSVTLLDESGNSSFPGTVAGRSGNIDSGVNTFVTGGSVYSYVNAKNKYANQVNWLLPNTNISNGIWPVFQGVIPQMRANKLAFMKLNEVNVEFSQDGGLTWAENSAITADNVASLFINKTNEVNIDTDLVMEYNNAAADKFAYRINIVPADNSRYSLLRYLYIYADIKDATACADIYYSLKENPNVYFSYKTDIPISGSPGPNMIEYNKHFASNFSGQGYGLRIVIRRTSQVSSGSGYINLYGISAFGSSAYDTIDIPMAQHDHMYDWDVNGTVIFKHSVVFDYDLILKNYPESHVLLASGQSKSMFNLGYLEQLPRLEQPIIVAGTEMFNDSLETGFSYQDFSADKQDAILISKYKINFTKPTDINVAVDSNLANLSGNYYIYTFHYNSASNTIFINGQTYNNIA